MTTRTLLSLIRIVMYSIAMNTYAEIECYTIDKEQSETCIYIFPDDDEPEQEPVVIDDTVGCGGNSLCGRNYSTTLKTLRKPDVTNIHNNVWEIGNKEMHNIILKPMTKGHGFN